MVIIGGQRQVGKTTLEREFVSNDLRNCIAGTTGRIGAASGRRIGPMMPG